MPKGQTGRRHGTASMYVGGCRCDPCTVAMREYHREWTHRTGLHVPMAEYLAGLPEVEHGTETRYGTTYGCRCDECREASNAARRRRNAADPELARQRWREQSRKRAARIAAGVESPGRSE